MLCRISFSCVFHVWKCNCSNDLNVSFFFFLLDKHSVKIFVKETVTVKYLHNHLKLLGDDGVSWHGLVYTFFVCTMCLRQPFSVFITRTLRKGSCPFLSVSKVNWLSLLMLLTCFRKMCSCLKVVSMYLNHIFTHTICSDTDYYFFHKENVYLNSLIILTHNCFTFTYNLATQHISQIAHWLGTEQLAHWHI